MERIGSWKDERFAEECEYLGLQVVILRVVTLTFVCLVGSAVACSVASRMDC